MQAKKSLKKLLQLHPAGLNSRLSLHLEQVISWFEKSMHMQLM
jgi:hypothetical protein